MFAITSADLSVVAPFDIESIYSFSFIIGENEHSTARLTVKVTDSIELVHKEYLYSSVTILAFGEVVFSGILSEVRVAENFPDQQLLYFTLKSASIILDRTHNYRSFQDINLLYSDVLDTVFSSYGGIQYTLEKDDAKIDKPIIQYNETDWQFAKRLASHFSTSLIPEYKSSVPGISIGLPTPKAQDTTDLQDHDYDVVVSNQYVWTNDKKIGYDCPRISSVIVTTRRNLEIGSKVFIGNQSSYIFFKSADMVNDVLYFTYKLSGSDLLYNHKYYNQHLSGRSLTGRVIDVEKDMLKLHLKIDAKQEKSTAYWFQWAPITGNLFYLMPELNENVSLYFHDGKENEGKVINCIRKPIIRESGILADPNKRQLRTKDHKKIILYPNETGYCSDTSNTNIMLTDGESVAFDSPKSINILAAGQIRINSQAANFLTPINLGLYAIGLGESITEGTEPMASIDFSGPTVSMFSKHGKASLKFQSGKGSGTAHVKSPTQEKITDDEFAKIYAGYTSMGKISDDAAQASDNEIQKIACAVASTAAPLKSDAFGTQSTKTGSSFVGLTTGGTSSIASALLPASLKQFQEGQVAGRTKDAQYLSKADQLKSTPEGKSFISVSSQSKPLLDHIFNDMDCDQQTIPRVKTYSPCAPAKQILNQLKKLETKTPKHQIKHIMESSTSMLNQHGLTESSEMSRFCHDVYTASLQNRRRMAAGVTTIAEALEHRQLYIKE